VDTFVQNQDVFATALALVGVESPQRVDGRDVWPSPDDSTTTRSHVITGFNYDVMLRTPGWGYIARADGSNARLYDLRADPAWRTDVAADHTGTIKELRQLVEHDAGEPLPNLDDARERIATEWYRQA
jgi:arylsulfatase A-like enzyme